MTIKEKASMSKIENNHCPKFIKPDLIIYWPELVKY